MLDVRGNCSILRRSCVTQPFVWRGSTRVLRRSFAGSRGSIYCLRGGEGLYYRVLFSCVVYDTALCMAWVHAGPAQGGSIVAWRRGHHRRGHANNMTSLSCKGPALDACHTPPTLDRK